MNEKPAIGRRDDQRDQRRRSPGRSLPHRVVLVDERRLLVAVDRDHDRQADRRLGRRDGDDDQRDDRRARLERRDERPNAMIARLTALSISSIDISMLIALRRARNPNVPIANRIPDSTR